MSQYKIESIKCKHCKRQIKIQAWGFINVSIDPQLKERALDGKLFLFDCLKCGKQTEFIYPLLYNDIEYKLMINFHPEERETDNVQSTGWSSAIGEDYTARKVTGADNFTEKLLIIESALDDRAIECLKYLIGSNQMVVKGEQGGGLEGKHILFKGICQEEKKLMFTVKAEQADNDKELKVDLNLYEQVVGGIAESSELAGDHGANVNQRWIALRLNS